MFVCCPNYIAAVVDARDVAKLLLAREACPLDQMDDTGRSAMAHMAEFRPGPHGWLFATH
jgi:hypothetical protein